MKDYASRKFIHLEPMKELVINGNEYNDYKSLFVKEQPKGGIRMKNLPDFRFIEVNNLGIIEDYLDKLDTVRYYFTYFSENDEQRWDIFHDGNYEEFFYTES